MAGERIGRFYEALVVLATQRATSSANPGQVTWNPATSDLMVAPDICIGDPARPDAVILITRSGARRNWHQKFWRNVGEIVDIRGSSPSTRLLSVSLGTEIKEELNAALTVLVDLHFSPPRAVRTMVENWARSVALGGPSGETDLLGYATEQVSRSSAEVLSALQSTALRSTLESPGSGWVGVNTWLRSRKAFAVVAATNWVQPGAFRRGMAKLLVFGEPPAVLPQIATLSSAGRYPIQRSWGVLQSFDRDLLAEALTRATSTARSGGRNPKDDSVNTPASIREQYGG
jgi:hypothetical protein